VDVFRFRHRFFSGEWSDLRSYDDSTSAGGVHGLPEEHEDIRVVVKPWAEIEVMLDAGAIKSGHTLIALCWLSRHRQRLRQLWAAR
jgi:ADP-ribose pyrophosphatase